MKRNHEIRIFLISMLVNMIISYIMGYRFKSHLLDILSDAIYYQLIIFISLLMPIIIKKCDTSWRMYRLNSGLEQLKKDASNIKTEHLNPQVQPMFTKLINSDVKTDEKIKSMYSELEELSK
ncbi:hypothetical protein P2W49_18830 [Yersinia intermedia]|nr:hypothetical protein P2W49_18830 [Yersinia intermedia]